MQRQHFVPFALAALVALSTAGEVVLGSQRQAAIANPAIEIAQAETKAVASFTSAAHRTDGTASIVTEGRVRYLELSDDFRTDNGPDLFVLLHKQERPSDYDESNYVNLGRLERVSGTQRYIIPDGVELDQFSSVVVWCREFNVTFGYAVFS